MAAEDSRRGPFDEAGDRRVRLPRARPAKVPPFMAIEIGSLAGIMLFGQAIVGGVLGLGLWLVKWRADDRRPDGGLRRGGRHSRAVGRRDRESGSGPEPDPQMRIRGRYGLPVRKAVWSIAATLILCACQPEADSAAQSGRIEVTLDDLRVVPAPDVVARIVDVEPAEDGRVWVLNSLEPFFVVLGIDGQVERSFGSRGGGPEEFDDPIALVGGPSGQMWTFDNLRRAFRPLADDPTADRALPMDWQAVSFEHAGMGMVATAPWVQSQGEDLVIARIRPSAPPGGGLAIWHADIYRVGMDSEGVSLEPSLAVPDLLADPGERYPGANILMPFPLWTVCEDGAYGLYDPLANTIRRFTADGSEESPIALDEERREAVTFDRVFGMVYRLFSELRPGGQAPDSLQMRGALQQQFEQAEGAFSDVFPEYADLRCTDEGTFWLQPYHLANGRFERSPAWTRFNLDGSRTTISLPEAFTVHQIESDRIWGAVVDALGVPSVAWLRVEG